MNGSEDIPNTAYTEDDTFRALRRTPFPKLVDLVSESIGWSSQWLVEMWATSAPRGGWTTGRWIQIYKNHGWTFEEIHLEAKRVWINS